MVNNIAYNIGHYDNIQIQYCLNCKGRKRKNKM